MGNYGLSQKEGVVFTVKTLQKIGMEGKVDSYMPKNEIRTFSNTIHKEKLKMDQRPNCKAGCYQTHRGKQNTV